MFCAMTPHGVTTERVRKRPLSPAATPVVGIGASRDQRPAFTASTAFAISSSMVRRI
jgi:hypothetical protein